MCIISFTCIKLSDRIGASSGFNQKMHPEHIPGHSDEEGAYPCKCSGWGIGDLYTLEIVDMLRIPKDTPAGDYVLGWRWDCEQSTQVWSSCSDVTIKV